MQQQAGLPAFGLRQLALQSHEVFGQLMVSVIIPAFRSAGYIAGTLSSVFSQTFTDVVEFESQDARESENTKEFAYSISGTPGSAPADADVGIEPGADAQLHAAGQSAGAVGPRPQGEVGPGAARPPPPAASAGTKRTSASPTTRTARRAA